MTGQAGAGYAPSGAIALAGCPTHRTEYFLPGTLPTTFCPDGDGRGAERIERGFFDWLREHTEYLRQANNWDYGGRPANRLLSGSDIATAKAWAARRPKDAPEPTPLQLDFIGESEAEDIRQQSAETQRLREVAEIERKAKEALQIQLDRANQALAESIMNGADDVHPSQN